MTSIRSTSAAAGVGCSLLASALFGLLYYFASVLAWLGSLQGYGWRILGTFPLLTAFLLLLGHEPQILAQCSWMMDHPKLWLLLPLSLLLLSVQLWLFIWAPIHGHALDVSLGYFLLPLALFGLLSYVEPMLLVSVAFLLGERIDAQRWPTYAPIWMAVVLLCIEAARHVLSARQSLTRMPAQGRSS